MLSYNRPPVQSPINPPYKDAVDMKKQDQLAKPVVPAATTGDQLPQMESLTLDQLK